MNRCKRCQVDIADETSVCPLCETVLTQEGKEQYEAYPNVRNKVKAMKLVVQIATYVLIVLELIFLVINYYMPAKMRWSLVTGICILYTVFTLHYSFNRRNGHIRKLYWQAAAAIVLLFSLDLITGWAGWSLVYGLPSAILLLDAILAGCMLINRQDWQSYLLVQLFALVLSMVSLGLYLAGITRNAVLPWLAFGVSAVIFSFCLIIGNRTAKNELKRRFYI